VIAQLDKLINLMYHAGIGNDDSRMVDAWRQFDAIIEKEST